MRISPATVHIVEVGPRDGLQNEARQLPTAIKIELIERLVTAGLRQLETAAFVSPRWVPQMADSAAVMAVLPRHAGVSYAALVPNLQGWTAAQAVGLDEIVIFGAASETFSQKNTNCSIDAALARFEPVAAAVKAAGLRLRGSVSCALGCPFEGEISIDAVVKVARAFKALGCDTIDIADTIGVGTPARVQAVLNAVMAVFEPAQIAGHFHDTYGQALVNVYAALEVGITTFHSSVAGLGGCPYAPGATGNLATEDLVYLCNGLGIDTGIDLPALAATGHWIAEQLGHPVASRVGRALNRSQSEHR